MKRLLIAFSLVFLIFIGFCAHVGHRMWTDFSTPGSLDKEKFIIIPQGYGLKAISTLLEENALIDDAFVFYWGARLRGLGSALRAGEYKIEAHLSPEDLIHLLVSGKVYQHKYTAAEGLTSSMIVGQLQSEEALSGEIHSIPEEGTLLPETYNFVKGESRTHVIERMKMAQSAYLDKLWQSRPSDCLIKTKEDLVILASIIEKETALAQERPFISAVFQNRLKIGMPLQSDPTVAYALYVDQGRSLNQALTKADLGYASSYNTYLHRGLPPKPICNPGKASLEAVLHPHTSKDLYFVADGTGGHVFSSTLKDHQQNHVKWRKIRREMKAAQLNKESSTRNP